MLLAVSIDVEEEGLFSNRYETGDVPATNVPELSLLDPIFRALDIRPTLMVSYQAMRTPPLQDLPYPEPVPSEMMPRELLVAKLNSLLYLFRGAGIQPVSFRMGRFNIGPKMLSVLSEMGIRVDSSVAPMRKSYGGSTRLYGPVDPYFPDEQDPYRTGSCRILEVPVTIVPLTKRLGFFLEGLGNTALVPEGWISWLAMNIGSLPAQPAWTGLKRLKAAAKLHRARGGKVLSVFFHSSELMPGGYPGHPTYEHVRRFLEKLASFFSWIKKDLAAQSVTLAELAELYHEPEPRIAAQRKVYSDRH